MNGADLTKTVLQMDCSKWCRRWGFAAAANLDDGRAVMKIFKQSRWVLSKNLIRPLPVQNCKDGDSGDLLSWSLVLADARDEVDYERGAAARGDNTLARIDLFFDVILWIRYMGRISRRDRDLKPIMFLYPTDLEAKSPKKIKLQKEAVPPQGKDWISADHSRGCRVPVTLARPGEARRARVGIPFSPHTHSLVKQRQPHYLSWPSSTSTSKVGLKVCTLHFLVPTWAFEILFGITEILNRPTSHSKNSPPDLKCSFIDLCVYALVRTVKLNSHLELQATLIYNLNNRLHL